MSNLQDHMNEQNAITAAAEQEAQAPRRTRGPDQAPRATKKRNTELDSEVAAQRIVIALLQNQLSGGNPGSSTPMIDAIKVELPGETKQDATHGEENPMLHLIAEIMGGPDREEGYAIMADLGRKALKWYRGDNMDKAKVLPGLLAVLLVHCHAKGIDFEEKLDEARDVASNVLPEPVTEPDVAPPVPYSTYRVSEAKMILKRYARDNGIQKVEAIEDILCGFMHYCIYKGWSFDWALGGASAELELYQGSAKRTPRDEQPGTGWKE